MCVFKEYEILQTWFPNASLTKQDNMVVSRVQTFFRRNAVNVVSWKGIHVFSEIE